MDPSQWSTIGVTAGGALLAVIATLRYVKNTEEDSVAQLRQTVTHLEQQVTKCRRESEQIQKQLNKLVAAMRMSNTPFPDGFWDT